MKSLAASMIGLAFAAGAPENAWAAEAEQVLRNMHQINQVVVKAASLAQSRAGRDDVRSYARRLEMDHRFSANQLLDLAEELDVQLTLAPHANTAEEQRHQKFSERLSGLEALRGPDFDDAFIGLMRAVHLDAIDMLSSAQRDLSPGLVRALDRMIPIYEQHVELAVNLTGSSEARAEADR